MTQVVQRDETLQQLLQLALSAGRKRQSEQTGFVHIGDAIPIVENVLFALALLRSKTADHIIEGKEILQRILHFQCSNGNFPTCLHEYPKGEDYFLCAELLAPFHWILHDFGTVLGATRFSIEESYGRIKQHLAQQEVKPQPAQAVKIDAAFGRLQEVAFASPKLLGQLFVAQQLAGIPLSDTPWNREACCYDGAGLMERQEGYEPEVTLYDLFMGYMTGTFSERALKDHPVHLHASLIQPIEMRRLTASHLHAVSNEDVPDHEWRWHHRFKRVWGTPERTHSFVCQGGNIRSWHFDKGVFHFELGEPIEDDHRNKQRELSFYLDRQPIKILVNGVEATTFQPEDELRFVLEDGEIRMQFDLEDGEGEFMGHVMLGNRPSQMNSEAYDWHIFLRTIRRSKQCCVRVSLQFSSH